MVSIANAGLSRAATLRTAASTYAAVGRAIASVNLSSLLPATIHTAAALKFTRPGPVTSALFPHWQLRNVSTDQTRDLLSLFNRSSKTLSSRGISPAQFEQFSADEVIKNIGEVVDSFFLIDPPDMEQQEEFLDSAFVCTFRQNAGAKAFQQNAFLKIADAIGISLNNNRLCLKHDFKASDCLLLATPNGRAAMAQIIRSLSLLDNHDLALEFQAVLLVLARRYQIPVDKMRDITLALEPDYWERREKKESEDSSLDLIAQYLKQQEPKESVFVLPQERIEDRFLAPTANLIADFFLGHGTNNDGSSLKNILQNLTPDDFFEPNGFVNSHFFPLEQPKEQGLTDTQRCFRQNPLLRYTHRKLAEKALEKFHLIVRPDKSISLDAEAGNITWLQANGAEHRRVLLRIIKSLRHFGNHTLADNLQTVVFVNLCEAYTEDDRAAVLEPFDIPLDANQGLAPIAEQDEEISNEHRLLLETIENYLQSDDDNAANNNAQRLQTELEQISKMNLSDAALFDILNMKDAQGRPLLIFAIGNEHNELTQTILSCIASLQNIDHKKALLNARTKNNNTAFFAACAYHQSDTLKTLLDVIQDFDEEFKTQAINTPMGKNQQTLLCFSLINELTDCANALLDFITPLSKEAKFDILKTQTPAGSTALKIAIENQLDEIYSRALEMMEVLSEEQKTRILAARNTSNQDLLGFIIHKNRSDYLKQYLKLINNFEQSVKLGLIDRINPNYQSSPICFASGWGHNECVQLLLEELNNLDDERKDSLLETQELKGYQAILYALLHKKLDTFNILIKAKERLTPSQQQKLLMMQDKFSYNFILSAAETAELDIMQAALSAIAPLNADQKFELLNAKNANGRTALSLAAERGNKDVVDLLLKEIMAANARHNDKLEKAKKDADNANFLSKPIKNIILERERKSVHNELYELLSCKDQTNQSALALAKKNNYIECVNLLTEAFNSAQLSDEYKKRLINMS